MTTASRVMQKKMLRLHIIALAFAISMGVFFAQYSLPVYAHGESMEVTPSEAKPGDSVTITGDEFPPNEELEMSLESARGSVPLGHVEADGAGAFSSTIAIPDGLAAGSYQIVAATEDDNVTVDFTILAGVAESHPEGGSQLVFERNSSEVVAIGLITAALILGGTVLVLAGTRRHA